MLRIQFDTSSLFETIVKYRKSYQDFFKFIYAEHMMDELQIVIPDVVAAELYGILRAGRTGRYMNGEYKQVVYTHKEIMEFISIYPALFNPETFNHFNKEYLWQVGENTDGVPLYKADFYEVIKRTMGWSDLGKGFY